MPGAFADGALIWATLIGWLFWKELPDMPVILGSVTVISSNLYIVICERRKKKTAG